MAGSAAVTASFTIMKTSAGAGFDAVPYRITLQHKDLWFLYVNISAQICVWIKKFADSSHFFLTRKSVIWYK